MTFLQTPHHFHGTLAVCNLALKMNGKQSTNIQEIVKYGYAHHLATEEKCTCSSPTLNQGIDKGPITYMAMI
jgi:hypothetical protein